MRPEARRVVLVPIAELSGFELLDDHDAPPPFDSATAAARPLADVGRPLLVDFQARRVVRGAAKLRRFLAHGIERVAVVRLEACTDRQRATYLAADDRIRDLARRPASPRPIIKPPARGLEGDA